VQEQPIGINATLIVQAFNFLIAYIIVRKLFLRPAIDALYEDAAQKESLDGKINERVLSNNAREDLMRTQWLEFQKHVAGKVPELVSTAESVTAEDVDAQIFSTTTPSSEQIDFMAKSIAHGLVKRIDHVRE